MTDTVYATSGLGPAFLLKIGRDSVGDLRAYVTVAGLRIRRETSTDNTLDILGRGVFTARVAQHEVSRMHFDLQRDANAAYPMQLAFENGRVVEGNFAVADCQFISEHEDEELWEVRLVSRDAKERNT